MQSKTRLWALAAATSLMGVVVIAQTTVPNYDPLFVPATSKSLVQAAQRNSKNADALVKLIRKSIESKQTEAVFKTLDKMRREQPNNAVVLAAYVMAHDASLYQVRRRTGIIRQRTEQETQTANEALARAKQLNPKLWLPYTIEGFQVGWSPPWDYDRGLTLLQKGVDLAPRNSFARHQFALVLSLAANNKGKWQNKVVTHRQAAEQCEIALKFDPKAADTAFLLFALYDIDLKDKAGATRAKRAFLKALPPKYNISKSVRERLALYPD